jgi:hypothetical protein
MPLIPFTLGIENTHDSFFSQAKKKNWRLVLITNQTGSTQQGKRSLDVLRERGLDVRCVGAPEHGLQGTVVAGATVGSGNDLITGIPVISLYKNCSGAPLPSDVVESIDCFCFDIQDCGMRHYTFISTLYRILQLARDNHKKVVVFDRPNLLGSVVSGPLVSPDLISFISIAPIPLRYGLTIGELAHYYNRHFFKNEVDLRIVPMRGYTAESIKRYPLQAPLSPNIQTVQAVYGYSFLGIIGEIRPFDVGIGTADAFTLLMLPESLAVTDEQWKSLQKTLASLGVGSTLHQYYSERKKMVMRGLRLQIDAIERVQNLPVVVAIVRWAAACKVPLIFSESFDKAVGVKTFRQVVAIPRDSSIKKLVDECETLAAEYVRNAQAARIYRSMPLSVIQK